VERIIIDTVMCRDREGPRDVKPAQELERLVSEMGLMSEEEEAGDTRLIHDIREGFDVRN
jgi:hypothetical protein